MDTRERVKRAKASLKWLRETDDATRDPVAFRDRQQAYDDLGELLALLQGEPVGRTLGFSVYFPGEPAAGLHSFSDTVFMTVESGNVTDMAEFMLEALREFYDGATVEQTHDYLHPSQEREEKLEGECQGDWITVDRESPEYQAMERDHRAMEKLRAMPDGCDTLMYFDGMWQYGPDDEVGPLSSAPDPADAILGSEERDD